MRFVHGMGTNVFEGADSPVLSVFTTNIGRFVDVVAAVGIADDTVMLLSSCEEGVLYKYLDRYLFPADDVAIEAVELAALDVIGGKIGAGVGVPGDALVLPAVHGATVVARPGSAMELEGEWADALGRRVRDDGDWHEARVECGVPAMGHELTLDYNPLEAGLWHCVSFDKGCYIGQETIARLNTYDGVKQELHLLHLDAQVPVGAPLTGGNTEDEAGTRAAGIVTSVACCNGQWTALAYIRRKSGLAKPSAEVNVGGIRGVVRQAPLLTRSYESRSVAV